YIDDQLALVLRKRVYPYDYIDSQNRFNETELPHITNFIVLLKTDILSLADVWTEFRKMFIEYYEFDSSHYISAPSLSWDGM
ncbi:14231_t:CDS:2, partial [Funneliformis geosporum]